MAVHAVERASRRLRWYDAFFALAVSVVANYAAGSVLRVQPFPLFPAYIGEIVLLVVALVWYAQRGRFAIGNFSWKSIGGWRWFFIAIVCYGLAFHSFVYRHGMGAFFHQAMIPVATNLMFMGIVVGICEEFLFRGVVQSSLSASRLGEIKTFGTFRLSTVLAALLFGLYHLNNLRGQTLAFTLQQIGFAIVLGLFLGQGYDRTRNIWGSAISHNAALLTFYVLPALLG